MPKLKTINLPVSLSKMAYDALRESILSGQLKPNEMYNEMALAKELGISRTPVREALLELSSQSLITFLPRRGVQVNNFSTQDVEEIFELRLALELSTVEKLARFPEKLDFRPAEKALSEQRRVANKKDYLAFLEADRVFHLSFSHLSQNRRFVAILENVRDILHLMGRTALATEGRFDLVIEEHQKVLEAVRRGDPKGARAAMKNHLLRSKEAVLLGRL
ncbi:MAG: GntR family transcriptional regulator [Thermodesulfobacteriota bacterium]